MMIRVSDVLTLLYPDGLKWITEDDLELGSRLHFMMEIHCNNIINGYHAELPVSGLGNYQEFSRIEAVTDWIIEQQFVPLEAESEHYDTRHQFYAHPDCVGYRFLSNKGGKWRKDLTLDWKFAEAITIGNLIQAEAYRRITGNPVWLVQCNRAAKITIHKCKPRPDLWAVFLSGLNVLKFQQKNYVEPKQYTPEELSAMAQEVRDSLCQIQKPV